MVMTHDTMVDLNNIEPLTVLSIYKSKILYILDIVYSLYSFKKKNRKLIIFFRLKISLGCRPPTGRRR